MDVLWENERLVVLDIGVRLVGRRSEEGDEDSTIVAGACGTAEDLRRVMGEMVEVAER